MISTEENWTHFHLLRHYQSRAIDQSKGKNNNDFSSVCIDEYILILGPYLIIISKNLSLKTLIITIADDIVCNNFLHFGYKKTA